MPAPFYYEEERKARWDQVCDDCGEIIPKGTMYTMKVWRRHIRTLNNGSVVEPDSRPHWGWKKHCILC